MTTRAGQRRRPVTNYDYGLLDLLGGAKDLWLESGLGLLNPNSPSQQLARMEPPENLTPEAKANYQRHLQKNPEYSDLLAQQADQFIDPSAIGKIAKVAKAASKVAQPKPNYPIQVRPVSQKDFATHQWSDIEGNPQTGMSGAGSETSIFPDTLAKETGRYMQIAGFDPANKQLKYSNEILPGEVFSGGFVNVDAPKLKADFGVSGVPSLLHPSDPRAQTNLVRTGWSWLDSNGNPIKKDKKTRINSTTGKKETFSTYSDKWERHSLPSESDNLVGIDYKGKHYYALDYQMPGGVRMAHDTTKINKITSGETGVGDPVMRPETAGQMVMNDKGQPGNIVGYVSYQGNKHPVYDSITITPSSLEPGMYRGSDPVTGSFTYSSPTALTFRGKQPSDWSGKDFHDFGKMYGVDNLGPADEVAWSNSIIDIPMRDGTILKVPGGFDGQFSYYDMHYINTQGIDIGPEWFTPGTKSNFKNTQDYWKVHDKMMRSVQPSQSQMTDQQIFTQFMFGLTSPGNKLTPNLLAVGRIRPTSRDDIKQMSRMIPWKVDDPEGTKKIFKERFSGEPYVFPKPKEGIKAREGTIRDPEGNLVTASSGQPAKKNIDETVRLYYSKKMANALGVGPGSEKGIGAIGNADYTNLAEFAQMFLKKPKWFRKNAKESWTEYSERLSSQIGGLRFKTASFSGIWQDTMGAQVAPVDRHIAVLWLRNSNSTGATAAKKLAINKWNSLIKDGNPHVKGASTVKDFDELQNQKGSYAFLGEVGLGETGKNFPNSKLTKTPKFRLANGKINPVIPKHLRETKWIKEPEYIEVMPDNYRDALNTVGSIASSGGRGMYNQQWGVWDPMRHRLSPHEAMFPGLQYLPRMNKDQYLSVRDVYSKHGFLGTGKTSYDPQFGPSKPVQGGPSKLAYFGLLPPAIASKSLISEEETAQ